MAKTIKKKDINLILAMYSVKKKPGRAKNTILAVLIIIIAIAAIATVAYYFISQQSELVAYKAELNQYLENPEIQAQYNQSIEAQVKAFEMSGRAGVLEQVLLGISSHPNLTKKNINKVYSFAEYRVDISDFSYSRETGILTFNATSSTPTVIPVFIANLRLSGIFEDVQYQGYSGSEVMTAEAIVTDPLTGEETVVEAPEAQFSFAVTALKKIPEPKIPSKSVKRPKAEKGEKND